jgi:hypothetical protein
MPFSRPVARTTQRKASGARSVCASPSARTAARSRGAGGRVASAGSGPGSPRRAKASLNGSQAMSPRRDDGSRPWAASRRRRRRAAARDLPGAPRAGHDVDLAAGARPSAKVMRLRPATTRRGGLHPAGEPARAAPARVHGRRRRRARRGPRTNARAPPSGDTRGTPRRAGAREAEAPSPAAPVTQMSWPPGGSGGRRRSGRAPTTAGRGRFRALPVSWRRPSPSADRPQAPPGPRPSRRRSSSPRGATRAGLGLGLEATSFATEDRAVRGPRSRCAVAAKAGGGRGREAGSAPAGAGRRRCRGAAAGAREASRRRARARRW